MYSWEPWETRKMSMNLTDPLIIKMLHLISLYVMSIILDSCNKASCIIWLDGSFFTFHNLTHNRALCLIGLKSHVIYHLITIFLWQSMVFFSQIILPFERVLLFGYISHLSFKMHKHLLKQNHWSPYIYSIAKDEIQQK